MLDRSQPSECASYNEKFPVPRRPTTEKFRATCHHIMPNLATPPLPVLALPRRLHIPDPFRQSLGICRPVSVGLQKPWGRIGARDGGYVKCARQLGTAILAFGLI